MVPLTSLAIPVLVSAVMVFLVSSVIHMVLTYHRSDFHKLPNEDEALEVLRRLNIPPGDYLVPHATGPAGMKTPEFVEKMTRGPVVLMTLSPGGPPAMGKNLRCGSPTRSSCPCSRATWRAACWGRVPTTLACSA